MKNFSKIGLIILFLLCSLLLAFSVDAAENDPKPSGEIYSVATVNGGYEVYRSSDESTEPGFRSYRLTEIISFIRSECSAGGIRFLEISATESISFAGGDYSISGNIDFDEGCGIVIESGKISFSDLTVNFEDAGIRLKSGVLEIEDSIVSAKKTAVKMDYSSSSELILNSGTISSESLGGTLEVNYGTAKIRGGTVRNTLGAAIKNYATLIISNEPELSGIDCEIFAFAPITLSEDNNYYTGNCRIKFSTEFEKGKIQIIGYGAKSDNENNVILFDGFGREVSVKFYETFTGTSETNFLTAYIPYEMSFSDDAERESQYYLYGEKITLPKADLREGYEFLGWKVGSYTGEVFEPSLSLDSDIVLYPSYRLCAPTFSFLSTEFTYDGTDRYLSLSELSHSLISEGVMSYKWYKDGEELEFYGDRILIKNVSDTGKYKCLFTFSHKSDVVTVETPEVVVTIFKRTVDFPVIPKAEYNGEVHYPQIYSVSLYEAEYTGGVEAGLYPVRLTVRDSENYGFGENGDAEVTVYFEITKAANEWIEELYCENMYSWQTLSPMATAKFGVVKFVYSRTFEGGYSDSVPTITGTYYVKGVVEGTSNYSSLLSDPVSFDIMEDSVASIHIVSEALRKNYTAFETFSPEGLSVAARYVSGKEVIIENSDLLITYVRGTNFLFGDGYVQISYSGNSIAYPVSVIKAEYDVSSVIFTDCEYEYCGQYISPVFLGELPIGLDGIPLGATVVGGGTGAGRYGVELRFHGESENYNIPQSISAIMTVNPKEVDVFWESLSFVYDGKAKIPIAHYTDILGRDVPLSVDGARSYAGTYEASVTIPDINYTPKNPIEEFVINKADYDLSAVHWSGEKLTYDGTEHRVVLSGLPAGVNVIGYSDNRAVNAGVYVAGVVLSYDENNYNAPKIMPYEWTVCPAEYDESFFCFSDAQYVYDGDMHFPLFSGAMPVGIDGSSPTFAYSCGVSEVDEGKVRVIIEFSTDSKNYIAPRTRECFVEILPKGINVRWSNVSFVYADKLFSPSAEADECEIAVVGAQIVSGNHIATAKALNTNYFVINCECTFEILKASNIWNVVPDIKSIYESGALMPQGSAEFGETLYEYSADKEMVINAPDAAGIFYFRAVSEGDENHLSIASDWLEFQIIAVVPVALDVELLRTEFLTLEKISQDDIRAFIIYNDASSSEISLSDISVSYLGGDSFSFSDLSVGFSYIDFSVSEKISVSKRDYDLSSVSWEGIYGVYDGEGKTAYLTGLPDGVSVIGYVGNGQVNAGLYVVSANLAYDEENYNQPIVPDAVMTIERQIVVIPDIKSVEYTSKLIFPDVESSELYTYDFSGAVNAGTYTLKFSLKDTDNYCFDGNLDTVEKNFEITKKPITVRVSDVEVYLKGKCTSPSFEIISGSLAEGETLSPKYEIGESEVLVLFDESNYEIEVISGRVLRNNRLSPEDTRIAALIFGILLLAVISIIIILINRKRLLAYYHRIFSKGDDFIPSMPVIAETSGAEADDVFTEYEKAEQEELYSDDSDREAFNDITPDITDEFMAEESEKETKPADDGNDASFCEFEINTEDPTVIDAGYADSVITDSLARSLIRKERDIATEGNKKQIINVDTLSRSFSSGERVDINLLKGKSLIPYDTGYIKVLARGIIDKPLDVYANDFSLSAVKMIALAGGKSVKVSTIPKVKSISKANFNKKG